MFLYADRMLIQILAFSLGPLLGLVAAAFIDPWSGPVIGLAAFLIIFLQPLFSDLCLRNTARALDLGEIVLAEGKVTYLTRSSELIGKLFVTSENLVFVTNNQIDFALSLGKIVKVESKFTETDEDTMGQLMPMLEKKSPNLPQVTALVLDLTSMASGCLIITIRQSIFSNEFAFLVTNPALWRKTINDILQSRAS